MAAREPETLVARRFQEVQRLHWYAFCYIEKLTKTVNCSGGRASGEGGDHNKGCEFSTINTAGSSGEHGRRGGGVILLIVGEEFTMVKASQVLAEGGRGAQGSYLVYDTSSNKVLFFLY